MHTIIYLSILLCLVASATSLLNIRRREKRIQIWLAASFNFSSIVIALVLYVLVIYGGNIASADAITSKLLENVGRMWVAMWPLCYVGLPIASILLTILSLKEFSGQIGNKEVPSRFNIPFNLALTSANASFLLYITYCILPDA